MLPKKGRKLSVFMRYALSYTLIVVVLFSGVTFYLYRLTEQQVRESIVDTQINRLTRIAIQHESAVSAMLNTAEEIGLSPHIEPFRYGKEPWKAYDLQLQLIPYTATNAFCDQVYLHFSEDDHIYSSSSSMTVEMFTRLMRYEHTGAAELEALIQYTDQITVLPAQKLTSSMVDGSEPRMVTFILPLGANPGTNKGCMLFLVKESTYQNLFADAIDGDINTYIFSGGAVLSSTEDLAVSSAQVMTALESGQHSRVFREGGKAYLTVSLGVRTLGFGYAAVIRMEDVNSAVRGSLRGMIAMLMLIAGLGLLMAFWIARRHARVIRNISDLLTENGDERRDELQQISTGIRQLTRRNSELISRLDSALPMQRHDFVFRFMKGRFLTREDAVAAARTVGLDIDRACYAVILCGVPENGDWPLDVNGPPFDRFRDVTCMGVELVALKGILYLGFTDHPAQLLALAEAVRQAGKEESGQCVTAISAVHRQFSEAPTAYLEAAAAYDDRFVKGERTVLSYDDISSNIVGILPKAQKITLSISQALTLGSRELLDSRIGELLQFLKNTSMSPFAFRMIYNDVIDTLTRGQAAALSDGRDARDFYDIFSLSSCQSIDDLDELLRRLCDSLLTDAARERAEADAAAGDEMDQVVRYMEEHFSDPEISMAAIAESFGISTTRLSLSFKEKTGMTPLEYLTLLRSQRAKELLEDTDLTIRDISVQVGYYDSGSFTRRFKQITGETPLQYRRSHTEKKDH
ncbi:MAG: helix-turn-helix transcriptional regulator [Clostridia bacterium]|nr:helix-turn-helix transcriptional regulator [Clostridia bacterium]